MSLSDIGTPWSGPSGSPFITATSASRAAARAWSAAIRQNAFRRGFSASMRASTASTTSTGEISLWRMRAVSSSAGAQMSSSVFIAVVEARDGRDRRHCIIRLVGARRVVLHDRRARPSAVVDWTADATLAAAAVRVPDGAWITIEPRAATEAPWGMVDRLWRTAEPLALDANATALTIVQAVDWARI